MRWRSKIASILATSTTEAELISAASCAQDVAFCRKLADELGFKQTKPTILWEDNNGLFELSSQVRPLYKDRSKHFEIRFRFISDYVDRGLRERRHVDSKDQLTDLGTVPRLGPQLQHMTYTQLVYYDGEV